MAKSFQLTVTYCDKQKKFDGTYPDGGANTCLSNGNSYEVGPAAQTLTVPVSCCPTKVESTLGNTFTCTNITFSVPRNESMSQRYFQATVTWADGTTSNIFITQNGLYTKYVQVPITERYFCYQGNKYYAQRRMYSYDGVNYSWFVPAQYMIKWTVYSSGDTDCYDGECEWRDYGETYCFSGTLYSVQRKICDGAYTEEKRLNQAIGECEDPAEGYEYRWVLSTGLTICGENTSGGTTPDTGDTPDTGETITYDKWIEDGYTCSGYNRYVKEVHVYSNDGITYFPEYPPEERLGRLVEQNSEYCGYELKTQWRDDGDEGCYGTTLRHVLVKYVSDDMGVSWTKADPEETQPGDIIQTMSPTCGYIDWEAYKYIGVYDDDATDPHLVDYNGSYVVTTADTKPSGEDISHLTRIIIGSAVTAISDYCFESAVNLTQTGTLPSTLKSIGYGAFAYCNSLPSTGISLNEGLETIGTNAFNHCTSLEWIKIPSTVTSIGTGAFWGCSKLSNVTFAGSTPPTIGSNTFEDLPSNYVIYVPYAAVSTYKAAWPALADRIVGRISPPSGDDTM